MSNATNGGKVTTREFYNALLDQNKSRAEMEGRLGDKIDLIHSDIAKGEVRYEAQDKRIDKNDRRLDGHDDDIKAVNKNQKLLGLGEIVIAALASVGIGVK